MFKSYRPTGNKILVKPSPFNAKRFLPSSINFYQSGTASLAAAIIASCNLKGFSTKEGEVLLPAYACPDLISAILFAGAKPVLIDLHENSTFLSLDDIENKVTQNTVAIIAVNFLGISERIDKIKKICKKYQLCLINDSAQWFPKTPDIENWQGDFNIISFGRGKPVNLLHGGAVITKNNKKKAALDDIELSFSDSKERLSVILKILIYNTVIQPFFYGILTKFPGLNIGETKYTELMTITKMDNNYLSLLETNIEQYNSRKTKHELIHQNLQLISNPKIIDLYSTKSNGERNILLRYPLLITNKVIRDKFLEETASLGVSIMYKRPLYEIKGLENTFSPYENHPNASLFADHLVTIPTHEDIKLSVIDKIFEKLKSAVAL